MKNELKLIVEPTDPGFVYSHIKGVNQVFQKHANQAEIYSSNTPRAIDQDHNICNGGGRADKLVHWINMREIETKKKDKKTERE